MQLAPHYVLCVVLNVCVFEVNYCRSGVCKRVNSYATTTLPRGVNHHYHFHQRDHQVHTLCFSCIQMQRYLWSGLLKQLEAVKKTNTLSVFISRVVLMTKHLCLSNYHFERGFSCAGTKQFGTRTKKCQRNIHSIYFILFQRPTNFTCVNLPSCRNMDNGIFLQRVFAHQIEINR